MKPITCQWVESRLQEYLTGWCSPKERAAVDLHLADCLRCSKSVRIWSLLKNTVPVGDLSPLDPWVERRLLSGIDPGLLAKRKQRQRRHHLRRDFAAAAALLLVLLVAFFYINHRTPVAPLRRLADTDEGWQLAQKNKDSEALFTPIATSGAFFREATTDLKQINVSAGTGLWTTVEADVEIETLNNHGVHFRLLRGEVLAEVGPVEPDFRFVVETPNNEIEARGTVFTVQLSRSDQPLVRVIEGCVEIRDKKTQGAIWVVNSGQQYDGHSVQTLGPIDGFCATRFEGWASKEPTYTAAIPTVAGRSGPPSKRPHIRRNGAAPATADRKTLPATWLRRAQQCRQNKQYQAAAEIYEQLIELYPNDEHAAIALVALGQLQLTSLNQPARAVDLFSRHLAIGQINGSLYAVALAGRVRALSRLGDHRSVIDGVTRFLARSPMGAATAEMYRRRAAAYRGLGEVNRAIDDLERVIARWPATAEAARAAQMLDECRKLR